MIMIRILMQAENATPAAPDGWDPRRETIGGHGRPRWGDATRHHRTVLTLDEP